jgi:hypothetical protein
VLKQLLRPIETDDRRSADVDWEGYNRFETALKEDIKCRSDDHLSYDVVLRLNVSGLE